MKAKDQLLPRDILDYSKVVSGAEVEKEISKAVKSVIKSERITPNMNLVSGDSVPIKPDNLLLTASGSAVVPEGCTCG